MKTLQQIGFNRVSLIIKVGALEWLAHITILQDVYIQHAGNSNEKALWMKKLRVDGWCEEKQTVFEYDGCYLHGSRMYYQLSELTS